MPGRQAHGRPLISSKNNPKPTRKSKSKFRSRALDAFGIASEQVKEKRTPRHRELQTVEAGQKHGRAQDGDDEEEEDDDKDENDGDEEQPRRKRMKPSTQTADHDDSDEYGSDSEGNEWRYGAGEDDSDLDSDEAFGESDEERFQGYSFGGSSSNSKKPKRKQEKDSDEEFDDPDDFEPGDDGDSLGEDAIDLAQALDEAESESDEEEESAASGSDSNDDEASSPPSSDDEDDDDVDPSKLDALRNFISGFGGEDGEDQTQSGVTQRQKISFKDLGLAGVVKDPQMKKSMKLMSKEEKESRPGAAKKMAVPLSKRQQDKLLRSAAYDKTNETLDRWTETVKQNRRAEHLVFPLPENAHDAGLNHDDLQPLNSKSSTTELEQTIMTIMEQSGLALNKSVEKKGRAKDDEEGEGLSKEALKDLLNEKRRQRELNSREAKRQKRIKKIKSKAYHRIHRKQRERDAAQLHEAMVESGEVGSDDEREAQDRARALERVGARHRESRWAKAGTKDKRAVWDDDYRTGLHEMARQEEELRKRKEGRAGAASDESDDGASSGDDESDEGALNRNLLAQLDKADQYADDEPESKLMKMKFMQKGEAAKKKANDEMIAQIRRDLASDGEDGNEEEEEITEVIGRRKFGGEKSAVSAPALFAARAAKKKNKKTVDAGAGAGELAWDGPDGAADLNIGSSITTDMVAPKGNAWSTSDRTHKSKKKFKDASKSVDVISTTDIIGASSSSSKSKPKSKWESSRRPDTTATPQGQTSQLNAGADSDSDSDSDSIDIHLPTKIRDLKALNAAFAGDNVIVDFAAEKAAVQEDQDDKVVDNTLPGWGSWVGEGVSAKERARHKGRFLTTVEGTKKKDRRDAKLDKVIINEKRVKNNDKYLASQLPHPFESRAQYERSLRLPMGPEWMTKESFQDAVKPKVLLKQGIIAPMAKPSGR